MNVRVRLGEQAAVEGCEGGCKKNPRHDVKPRISRVGWRRGSDTPGRLHILSTPRAKPVTSAQQTYQRPGRLPQRNKPSAARHVHAAWHLQNGSKCIAEPGQPVQCAKCLSAGNQLHASASAHSGRARAATD
eukprot:2575703-Pleurochrysis_carterae.AAC.5